MPPTPALAPLDLEFVASDEVRAILRQDLAELEGVHADGRYKSTLVLAGAIVEGVLLDRLESLCAEGSYKPSAELQKLPLGPLIAEAESAGVLAGRLLAACKGLQDYRNVLHPGNEVRTNNLRDSSDADQAVATTRQVLVQLGRAHTQAVEEARRIVAQARDAPEAVPLLRRAIDDAAPPVLERLMLIELPAAEEQERAIERVDDVLDDARRNAYAQAYRWCMHRVPDAVRKRVMSRYAAWRRSVSDARRDRFELAFLRIEDLAFLESAESAATVEHLVGRIGRDPDLAAMALTAGIGALLTGRDARTYGYALGRCVLHEHPKLRERAMARLRPQSSEVLSSNVAELVLGVRDAAPSRADDPSGHVRVTGWADGVMRWFVKAQGKTGA